MLCTEADSVQLRPEVGVENMDVAIRLLEELAAAVKDKGYAVDLSDTRVTSIIKHSKALRADFQSKIPNTGTKLPQ